MFGDGSLFSGWTYESHKRKVCSRHALLLYSNIMSTPQSPGILTSCRHSDQVADKVGETRNNCGSGRADEGESLEGREQQPNEEARFNEQLT